MLVHAAAIGMFLYLVMRFGIQQVESVAQTRAVFLGLWVGLYMVTFGHRIPRSLLDVNPDLIPVA